MDGAIFERTERVVKEAWRTDNGRLAYIVSPLGDPRGNACEDVLTCDGCHEPKAPLWYVPDIRGVYCGTCRIPAAAA